MNALFRLTGGLRRHPDVEDWFAQGDPLQLMVRPWFEALHDCGPDVLELMHDHAPTACVDDAAFAYVKTYRAHAAIGFFHGADLPDPAGLMEGAGKRMRHVKLRWGEPVKGPELQALMVAAYANIRGRLAQN